MDGGHGTIPGIESAPSRGQGGRGPPTGDGSHSTSRSGFVADPSIVGQGSDGWVWRMASIRLQETP